VSSQRPYAFEGGASAGRLGQARTPTTTIHSGDPSGLRNGARLVAGVDLGSTEMKVLVADEHGAEVVTSRVATPWQQGPVGTTEMDAASLVDTVLRVMAAAAKDVAALTDARIEAIAISGMGETGMLIDDSGDAVTSAFAWFDPRGAEQAEAFPPWIRADFAGQTGLPLGAQVTVSKLAYLRDSGLSLAGLRWLNLPEFVAMALGGRVALEHSLTSRTGLIDQDSGRPWTAMLRELGCDQSLLPPILTAGSSFGLASSADLPANVQGAMLTVAGHDHLVAAEANGPLPEGHYHVSMGTAEVLLRVIDHPLGYEARARLADSLINEVRHVVPGKHVLVAGVKSGLVMRRILQAAGINDRVGRDRLDSDVINLPYEGHASSAIDLSGARNDDGVLQLAVRGDGVSPAEIFAAALRHTNDEIARLIEAMDRELPPARSSTLTGGWAGMAAVRRARERVLPNMTVSSREQETAFGAALVASRLLPSTPHSLSQ
jgi:sugar (pentulose or hexulose) kinase